MPTAGALPSEEGDNVWEPPGLTKWPAEGCSFAVGKTILKATLFCFLGTILPAGTRIPFLTQKSRVPVPAW